MERTVRGPSDGIESGTRKMPSYPRVLCVGVAPSTVAVAGAALFRHALVGSVSNVREALDLAGLWQPAVVVVDLSIESDPYREFLRKLRAGRRHPIAIVGLAGSALPEVGEDDIDGLLPRALLAGTLISRLRMILPSYTEASRWLPSLHQQVRRSLDHVDARMAVHDATTVRAIATAIRLTPGHLVRLVRADLGLTVRELVSGVRVALAKHVLATTVDKLDTVANTSGFCHAPHLCRVFQEHTGLSPTKWRRLAQVDLTEVWIARPPRGDITSVQEIAN